MEYRYLTHSCEGEICTLTINAPQTLNALCSAVLEELESFVDALPRTTRVLILTGAGSKAFVAGADIAEMSGKNREEGLAFGEKGARVFRKIEELPLPVIAAVNGYALGGGCELALACDIRVASENARFGQPEVGLGIIPGFSGTYRLPKLVGQGVAKELIYTGRAVKADEALRIGLVNAVVPQEELMNTVLEMARRIAAQAPVAVRNAKASINRGYDLDETQALALENRLFADCFATEDQKEGMDAFLNKRKAAFKDC